MVLLAEIAALGRLEDTKVKGLFMEPYQFFLWGLYCILGFFLSLQIVEIKEFLRGFQHSFTAIVIIVLNLICLDGFEIRTYCLIQRFYAIMRRTFVSFNQIVFANLIKFL
jgi:hypothetical protein